MSVKKIFDTIESTPKASSLLIQEAKLFHFLGTPIVAALIVHLFKLSDDVILTTSNKKSAEYVFNFVYRYLRYFMLSSDVMEKIVQLNFEYEMSKRSKFKRTQKKGVYEGNEPIFIDEEVLGTFLSYKGDRYYGEWRDKKIIRGAIFMANGNIYRGELYRKKPHGLGWMRTRNGNSFNGRWEEGLFQEGSQIFHYGKGVYGELVDSGKNRTGVTVYHQLDMSKTKHQKNKIEVEECLKGIDSSGVYVGQYRKEERWGQGIMFFADKSVYKGQWKKDKRHGQGTYYGINREKYSGDWHMDRREGFGEMIFENGDHYVGHWRADRMEGKGTHQSAKGDFREGEWKGNFFVSKLRENKLIHDGINQNRTAKKSVVELKGKAQKKMSDFLGTFDSLKLSEEILQQTKKIGM